MCHCSYSKQIFFKRKRKKEKKEKGGLQQSLNLLAHSPQSAIFLGLYQQNELEREITYFSCYL